MHKGDLRLAAEGVLALPTLEPDGVLVAIDERSVSSKVSKVSKVSMRRGTRCRRPAFSAVTLVVQSVAYGLGH
jgi:hypothetical protein